MGSENTKSDAPIGGSVTKKQKLEDLDLKKLADNAFNMIIFRLSPILGGRSEVLDTPVMEALDYLKMDKDKMEREKLERFQFLYFGANSKVDPKARKAFYEKLKPKRSGGRLLGQKKPLEWDYSAMDEFRSKS